MDGSRFDSLTKTLGTHGSRRRVLGGLLLGSLGLLSRTGADHVTAHDLKKKCKKKSGAAKKTCLKKAKKHAAQHASETSPPPPPPLSCPGGQKPCEGRCIPDSQCCADGECSAGAPRCCSGACVPVTQCCRDAHCTGGRTCQSGTCVCPANKPKTCPPSSVCAACCAREECLPAGASSGAVCQDGQCVCDPGKRRCPSGTKWSGRCGTCCGDGECSNGQECLLTPAGWPACMCRSETACDGVCVPGDCLGKCGQQCTNPGQPCCTGNGALICQRLGQQSFCVLP